MAFDVHYASVALLLHADGPDGSTAFVDNSPSPRTLTAAGDAKITAGTGVFGGSGSLAFDATGDYISTPYHANLDFGTGTFTVEAFVKSNSFALEQTIFAKSSGTNGVTREYAFSIVNATTLKVYYGVRGTNSTPMSFPVGTMATGVYNHIAFTRDSSNVIRAFVNGVPSGTTFTDATSLSGNLPAYIGAFFAGSPSLLVNGNIDELRITKGVARYTSTFFIPSEAFPNSASEPTAAAMVTLPSEVTSFGGGWAALLSPRYIVFAGDPIIGNAALQIGTDLKGYSGATGEVVLPTGSISASASQFINEVKAVAPRGVLSAYGGANARISAPEGILTLTGTCTIIGRAAIPAPDPSLSASGTTTAMASGALTTTPSNLVGYSGAVVSISLAGSPTLTATGVTGGIGGATITLPLFELTATGTVNGLSFADLIAPTPTMGATARAALVMPTGVLTAIGSAVVTVTYEAYALNLNHKPRGRDEPVDELTRYTNYPFDRIVRYKNSYFGMNSTGLFLLQGTTDDATPIPWDVQTAFTDFDSPQHKTVEMAYFGGRFGPAATVSLLVSENNTKTYTYTTPRDTDAQNYRQAFGRGNKARYYALGANGSGEMVIDSITFNVAKMARKV